MHSYKLRLLGIDKASRCNESRGGPYKVGDSVWVKPSNVRCDRQFGKGVVTELVSDVAVELDGFPRHISDLRPANDAGEALIDSERGDTRSLWGACDAVSTFSDLQEPQNELQERATAERLEGESGSVRCQPVRCLLYTSPSPRDGLLSRMPSSA